MKAAGIALLLIGHPRRRMVPIIRTGIVLFPTRQAVFVALAMLSHASLWAAIAARTGVSLLVIFNALRLLKQ
jgi:Cd2+/Zn2+-exporting ATPase